MENEEWRDVAGYEGRYQVSSIGRVRSFPIIVAPRGAAPHVHHASGRIMTQHRGRHCSIELSNGARGGARRKFVHRLVCEAFNGPPPFDGACVLHNDGNPFNNGPDNLRWGTQKENAADALLHGAMVSGENHPTAKLTDADVAAIREGLSAGASLMQMAKKYGVNRYYVFKIKHHMARPAPDHAVGELRQAGRTASPAYQRVCG